MLYSNPYSNADEHQRKYRTRNEQNMHISSTKRTRANTSEQRKSSPPFGTQTRLKPGYCNWEDKLVLLLNMVENSICPRELISNWFYPHLTV